MINRYQSVRTISPPLFQALVSVFPDGHIQPSNVSPRSGQAFHFHFMPATPRCSTSSPYWRDPLLGRDATAYHRTIIATGASSGRGHGRRSHSTVNPSARRAFTVCLVASSA